MDDDEPVRKLIAKMLETFGYTAVCQENGRDTLDCFIEEPKNGRPFVAMILDLTIPGGMGKRSGGEDQGPGQDAAAVRVQRVRGRPDRRPPAGLRVQCEHLKARHPWMGRRKS